MRRSFSVAASVAGFLMTADAAQQAPAPPAGAVVTVNVTVLDNRGKPVAGLTANEFEMRIGGKVQPVRSLSYVEAAKAGAPAPIRSQGRHTVSNAVAGESRVFVLLADDLSFTGERGKSLLAAADRFIDRAPASDFVGFASTSGTGPVNPALQRAPIHAALKAVTGRFVDPRGPGPLAGANLGIGEALAWADRNDAATIRNVVLRECFKNDAAAMGTASVPALLSSNSCAADAAATAKRIAAASRAAATKQLEAYAGVIDAMNAAPGIKQVIVLTDGLPVSLATTADLAALARVAARAGVELSALVEETDPSLSARRWPDAPMLEAGARAVADATGGSFIKVGGASGPVDPALDRVATAASALYRLEVELPAGATPGQALGMATVVRRQGVTTLANGTAVVPGLMTAALIDDHLRFLVTSGQPRRAVPMTMGAAMHRSGTPGLIDAGVNVDVPGSVKGPLQTMFGVIDEAGTVRTGKRIVETPAAGAPYRISFSVPCPPGTHKLRFAVLDAEGHYGSIESTIVAKLAPLGPFTASDVLTFWTDPAGKVQFLALDELPAGITTFGAAIELYTAPGVAPPAEPVRVKLALIPAGQTTPVVERDATSQPLGSTLRAEVQFPLAAVPAGTYTIRATVSIGATVAGTATTTIRRR